MKGEKREMKRIREKEFLIHVFEYVYGRINASVVDRRVRSVTSERLNTTPPCHRIIFKLCRVNDSPIEHHPTTGFLNERFTRVIHVRMPVT